jgi:hypothetical protein
VEFIYENKTKVNNYIHITYLVYYLEFTSVTALSAVSGELNVMNPRLKFDTCLNSKILKIG